MYARILKVFFDQGKEIESIKMRISIYSKFEMAE